MNLVIGRETHFNIVPSLGYNSFDEHIPCTVTIFLHTVVYLVTRFIRSKLNIL